MLKLPIIINPVGILLLNVVIDCGNYIGIFHR